MGIQIWIDRLLSFHRTNERTKLTRRERGIIKTLCYWLCGCCRFIRTAPFNSVARSYSNRQSSIKTCSTSAEERSMIFWRHYSISISISLPFLLHFQVQLYRDLRWCPLQEAIWWGRQQHGVYLFTLNWTHGTLPARATNPTRTRFYTWMIEC